MTGGLAPAFAAVLGIFLLGIAYGSREVAQLAKRDPDVMGRAILVQLAVAALAGLGLLPLVAWLATIRTGVAQTAVMLGVYFIARSWGMVLPYLAHLGIRAGSNAGRNVSWLYLANIAGSATGSILTGFVLLEILPLVSVARVLALYSVLTIAMLYLCVSGRMPTASMSGPVLQPAFVRMPAIVLGAMAFVVLLMFPFDRKEIVARLMLRERVAQTPKLAVVHESRSGIITVDKKGEVWGNGMYDGKFNTSLFPDTNGARRPFALSLFHPSPRHVLMIGLSTGSWAKIIANNPHVVSLTVIEISRGYAELIAGQPQVRSILSNPKVKLIVDDGRRWMRANPDRKFDFVVQNTTWHFRANIANLLSKEYLAMVGHRLKPGGVFFFNTTHSPRVQRTACSVFPHGFRYNNHMAVSRRALNPDFQRWRRTLLSYRIDGVRVVDLAKEHHRQGLARLMSFKTHLAHPGGKTEIETCRSVLDRTAGRVLITDDNMGTEWRYPFGLK